jgi:hypothetical protein
MLKKAGVHDMGMNSLQIRDSIWSSYSVYVVQRLLSEVHLVYTALQGWSPGYGKVIGKKTKGKALPVTGREGP